MADGRTETKPTLLYKALGIDEGWAGYRRRQALLDLDIR